MKEDDPNSTTVLNFKSKKKEKEKEKKKTLKINKFNNLWPKSEILYGNTVKGIYVY